MKTHTSLPVDNERHIYVQLQRDIHEALRRQHPEWIQPNGESPICDDYDLRLAELLGLPCDGPRRLAA